MKIPVVIEQGEGGFSAYAPDVPGCVAAGRTRHETLELMRRALEMHLRGLEEDGEPLPEPTNVEILEVSAA